MFVSCRLRYQLDAEFKKAYVGARKQKIQSVNIKKERRIMLLTVDPHAPTDFRGNLANHMDEFYEAFEIKEGDRMWIPKEERVRMW